MNWQAIGSLAELTAAVAVIGSIVYLSAQIRQAARATRSAAMDSWVADQHKLLSEMIRDPEFLALFRRGLASFQSMNKNEQTRFHLWMTAHVINAQQVFLRLRDGTFDARFADPMLQFNASLLRTPGGEQWWEQTRMLWSPEFVSHLEGLRESATALSDTLPWWGLETVTATVTTPADAG